MKNPHYGLGNDNEYFEATWDDCPKCGAVFGFDEYLSQRCMSCGWENGDEMDEDYEEDEDDS